MIPKILTLGSLSFIMKINIIVFLIINIGFILPINSQNIGDTGVATDSIFWNAVKILSSKPDSAISILKVASKEYFDQCNLARYNLCYQGIATAYQKLNNIEEEEKFRFYAYSMKTNYLAEIPGYCASSALNLGIFYSRMGNYQKALDYTNESLKIIKSITAPEDTIEYLKSFANTYSSLSSYYLRIGNYEDAKNIGTKAITLSMSSYGLNAPQTQLKINNLAAALFFAQDYFHAKSLFLKNLAIIESSDLKGKGTRHEYDCLHTLAFIYIKTAQPDSAKILINAIEKLPKIKPGYRPRVLHQIKGEYYLLVDSTEKALRDFKISVALREKEYTGNESINFLMDAYQTLASTYLLLNHPDSALQTYQSALKKLTLTPQSPTTPYPLLAVPILDGKAQAHIGRYHQTQQQPDLDTALWCYLIADSLVDKARDRLQNESSKLFFSQKSRPIYERAIRFCLMMHAKTGEPQYLEKAFSFSERNKATLLFQSLQDAGAKLAAGLPDSLLEQERNLKVDIAFYQNKIFEAEQKQTAADSARLTSWRQILFDREEAYRSFSESLEKRYPAYHQLKYDHRIVEVAEIQQQLSGSQMLLAFFEGDSAVYAFAIDRQGIMVHEVPRDSLLDKQIRQLLSSLQQPQKGLKGLTAFARPAHQLFARFLQPLIGEKSPDQLILIPDGQLSYLPFELLLRSSPDLSSLDDRQADRQYRHLPYFFRETSTRYAYSATLLFSNPYRPRARRNEVAAFAPAYSGPWSLVHNQPQAKAVAAMMGGTAFTGEQVNKARFLEAAPDFSVLHLAMHGEPDLYSPLRARLLFAGDDTAAANSLYAYEIYNLNLNAKMAVLAACESGYGKLEQSEGIYSLARAFRYAGCPSVVSSLWKADGQATIELMQGFYAALEEGASKSEALRAAKQQYLETASNAALHPYYWAGFVVIGDDGAIVAGGSWWWVVGLLLVGGGIGFGLTYSKRKERMRGV